MIEIERKFLVKSEDFKSDAIKNERIVQGFLNTDPLRTVRVRIKGDKGYMTVKGKGSRSGTTRFEWEKEISVKEAEALIKLSEPGVIDKLRYYIEVGNHIFEVDEFFGDNSGLIVAEIELEHEDEDFLKPQWLGDEVTSDIKYYNSQLSKNPFKTWKK
ncbi:CYTH domain-containing protein [Arenibacter sp. F26102]|uniref:CYTH domain-containing protein n=1 Tax=Arenibacter sp. F26102 TaxID=2926416 RepID=UPI001FF4FECA|nr:CYTH domain-containing protein [Arenibacter sp. F26102]MCK0147957.1 CYTH domain-containing protein [Arenibacter sp. F26102]